MVERFHGVWGREGRVGSAKWGPGLKNGMEVEVELCLVRVKGNKRGKYFGCDHTSTNAPDPIRTPQ